MMKFRVAKMKVLVLLSLCFLGTSLARPCGPLDSEWWKHTIIYEILPFSFKDYDGDGIGDIRGIISKLDHFVDLRIETIHLTPIYRSEFKDMGYDINDYYNIDPYFGTMDDFHQLIYEMNRRNMKLILDLVINHSSDKHIWFKYSVQRIEPYTDFYVWKDAKGFNETTGKWIPPNKWVNVFKPEPSSAWTWNDERKQFFLHQFLEQQPDFNLRNSVLKNELKKIIQYWLNKGVAGFRLDAAIFYIEDEYFRDDDNEIRQYNQDENYELIHEFREFLDYYNSYYGGYERIFIAEAHSKDHFVRRFYDRNGYNIAHFPYTFQLEFIEAEITSHKLNDLIEPWLKELPSNAVSAGMTQDHDGHRVGSRIHWQYVDILTIISMMLPGNVGIYYGQEIGMMDGSIEQSQIRDYSGSGKRDPARLPMQWDSSMNAGFSINPNPFLPVNQDYRYRNVELQKQQRRFKSHYQLFKDLSDLRQLDDLKYGNFKSYTPHEDVYAFTRSNNNIMILVLSNLKNQTFSVNIPRLIPDLPEHYIAMMACSTNWSYENGWNVEEFILPSYAAVVFRVW